MSSTTFEDLPDDVLLKIVDAMAMGLERQARRDFHAHRLTSRNFLVLSASDDERRCRLDLCALRLVSRRLSGIVHLHLFSELRITPNFSRRGISDYDKILETLSASPASVYAAAKRLVISLPVDSFRFEYNYRSTLQQTFEQKLVPAITNLNNLRILEWRYFPHVDRLSRFLSIVKALSPISTLQGLSLSIFSALDTAVPGFTLWPLSNLTALQLSWSTTYQLPFWTDELRALISRCPALESLSIGIYRGVIIGPGSFKFHLRYLFSTEASSPLCIKTLKLYGFIRVSAEDFASDIHRFQHLENLTIKSMTESFPMERAPHGEIYSVLRNAGIYLKTVFGHVQDHLLLDYLYSYSGVRELRMGMDSSPERSPDRVNFFFRDVLLKHRTSLKRLKLKNSDQGLRWFELLAENHRMELLIKCEELLDLHVQRVRISEDELGAGCCFEITFWLETALLLPKLSLLRFRYDKSDDRLGSDQEARRELVKKIVNDFIETHLVHFDVEF